MAEEIVPGIFVPSLDGHLPVYYTALDVLKKVEAGRYTELKTVKIVRTVSGMRRYQQDKGSIIMRDGEAPLSGITAVTNDVPGYEKVEDNNGNPYYIGNENGSWVVRDPKTNEVMHTTANEEDIYIWLNNLLGGQAESSDNNPFDSSPYNKPTDSQERRNIRVTLGSEKYGLDVDQAVAVDQMGDVGINQYREYRDRGMDHSEALKLAHSDDARAKAKAKVSAQAVKK